MKVLFLDDSQKRIDVAEERYKDDELTVVRTAEEAIGQLASEAWDLVCLDHDLNGEAFVNSQRRDCGMEVVRWMTEWRGELNSIAEKVIVHSSNLHGAREMYSALQTRGYYVFYARFRYE